MQHLSNNQTAHFKIVILQRRRDRYKADIINTRKMNYKTVVVIVYRTN